MAAIVSGLYANRKLSEANSGSNKVNLPETPFSLGKSRQVDDDDEDLQATREHIRRYESQHDQSVIGRLHHRLGAAVAQLRTALGLDSEPTKSSCNQKVTDPMPADRPEVVELMQSLADIKNSVGVDGRGRLGRWMSSLDGPASSVIQTATDLTLQSTNRMLALCEEAQNAAADILVYLDEQLEQLDIIENALGRINGDMREAEEDLKNLEKCCGLWILPWNQQPGFEDTNEYVNTWREVDESRANAPALSKLKRCRYDLSQATSMIASFGGKFVTRETNDAREDAIDANLQQITLMVATLCAMVHDINTELLMQNNQLSVIEKKAISVNERVILDSKRSNTLADS